MLTTRRRLIAGAVAATAGYLTQRAIAAEGPLETTTVRLVQDPSSCLAPQYIAEELLQAEGFTDIRYISVPDYADDQETIASGKADFALDFACKFVAAIEAGRPLTVLSGVHIGCFELIANDTIRGIGDLRGKSVGVQSLGSSAKVFLAALCAAIGLDPVRDIRWVTDQTPSPLEQFVAGKLDAFLGFPPEPQQLRARGIGRVIVSSTIDRPWSEYYCCMLGANNDYIRRHPAATKRVLRAILKAADLCASDPARTARRIVERGVTDDYEMALRTLRDIPYGRWRDYDAEDTLRFYALRLREAGMIRSSPQKIIAAGTDWRFIDELKRELKA